MRLKDVEDESDTDMDLNISLNRETCASYDVISTVSALHPCSISAVAITKNGKWIFTGGDDGFIRKYDTIPSLNGDSMLTNAAKIGLYDSIIKSGILVSAWDTEDTNSSLPPEDKPPISPVYSLAVHSDGVWILVGLENGSINLYTCRHEEGTCHHTFHRQTKPISAISISPDEKSFISGSQDKTIMVQ